MNNSNIPHYKVLMPGCLDLSQSNHALQPQMSSLSEVSITSVRQPETASVLPKMNNNINTGFLTSPSPTYMSPTYPMIQQRRVFTYDQCYNVVPGVHNTSSPWPIPQITAQHTQSAFIPWNIPPSHMQSQTPQSVPSSVHQVNPAHSNYTSSAHFNSSAQRQPFRPKENLPTVDSSNKLRSAIFDKILGSLPKLQQLMITSAQRIKKEPGCYSSCVYDSVPSSSSLASDIMEEENDMGYCSFSDISPVNSSLHSPASTAHEHSSSLNQILEDVLNCVDDLTDLKDLVSDIEPDDDCDYKPVFTKTTKFRSKPKTSDISDCASKKFQCVHCDKSFATRANLNIHVRSHSGDRPHKCHYCGKCFTQKSTLRTHIRIHTGEKPYKCSGCPKAFSDYSTYTKHARTHTGERPYVCDMCGKGFAQSGNMIRHRQMHFKNL